MPKCPKCNDTGVIDTGNNDLACDCEAGDTALFNIAGVEGLVTGREAKLHFYNDCLEPIDWPWKGTRTASSLPGRK